MVKVEKKACVRTMWQEVQNTRNSGATERNVGKKEEAVKSY
jgi:hypothetical protein